MNNKEKLNFEVPEGYFLALEKSILEKTSYYSNQIKYKPNNIYYRLLAVASVLIIITLTFFVLNNYKINKEIVKKNQEKEIIENIYKENEVEIEFAQLNNNVFYLDE
ncbi:MAG: hypothetical protein ACEQSF_01505 [Solirubrobacteraceae bacterium]